MNIEEKLATMTDEERQELYAQIRDGEWIDGMLEAWTLIWIAISEYCREAVEILKAAGWEFEDLENSEVNSTAATPPRR